MGLQLEKKIEVFCKKINNKDSISQWLTDFRIQLIESFRDELLFKKIRKLKEKQKKLTGYLANLLMEENVHRAFLEIPLPEEEEKLAVENQLNEVIIKKTDVQNKIEEKENIIKALAGNHTHFQTFLETKAEEFGFKIKIPSDNQIIDPFATSKNLGISEEKIDLFKKTLDEEYHKHSIIETIKNRIIIKIKEIAESFGVEVDSDLCFSYNQEFYEEIDSILSQLSFDFSPNEFILNIDKEDEKN